MNQRDHALETAARMIEARIAGLKKELAQDEARDPKLCTLPSDRAAIFEAELIVRKIRGLIGERLRPLAPKEPTYK